MKQLLYTLIVFFLGGMSAYAQIDAPTSYSSFFTLSASRYEPGNLGEDHETFEIALVNAYLWFGNTSLDIETLEKFTNHLDGDYLPQTEIDAILDRMGDKNRIGAGATIDLLNMMYKIRNSDDEEIVTLGFGLADRVEGNIIFPNSVFDLALNGNGKFEDQEIQLPLGGSFFYAREYTLSAAAPLPINLEGWKFRVGTRLKYLKGIEGMHTSKGDFSLYTAPNGQYLDLDYDYEFNSSINFDDDDYSFSPFSSNGKGFGADLGISAVHNDRWHGNINILDIGSVTFKGDNNIRYKKSGSFRYEGIFIDDIIDESELPVDSVADALSNELTDGNKANGQDFSMPYPTRMRIHLSYRIPKENKKGHTYYPHVLGFNFTQGFRDLGSATTRTYLAGSYTYNLNDVFEVGTNLGFLGYNKMDIGAFIALKLGFFRLGFGSGNITPIVRSFGTGMDFNFNMTMAF